MFLLRRFINGDNGHSAENRTQENNGGTYDDDKHNRCQGLYIALGAIGESPIHDDIAGVITKAPLGGDATGPSPVDRSKTGTKRSVLTDQRGAPLAVEVTGANTHDKTVALATLDGIVVNRPEKVVYRLHHLCLDKGYDYADVMEGVEERDDHLPLAKSQAEKASRPVQKKHPARRWVVERTHAWHNRFRVSCRLMEGGTQERP